MLPKVITKLTIAQLQALLAWLRSSLETVLRVQADAKRELDRLSTPSMLKTYTPEALTEKRQLVTEGALKQTAGIISDSTSRKETIDEQRQYWKDCFWRDAKLYPPVPDFQIGNRLSLLQTEQAVQALTEFLAGSNAALLEQTAFLRFIRELEVLDAETFIRTVSDASAQGQAAVLYIARLVIESRIWTSDAERARVRVALTEAENSINLPERTQALEILDRCTDLILDIESAYRNLATGAEDLRAKVRPYTEVCFFGYTAADLAACSLYQLFCTIARHGRQCSSKYKGFTQKRAS